MHAGLFQGHLLSLFVALSCQEQMLYEQECRLFHSLPESMAVCLGHHVAKRVNRLVQIVRLLEDGYIEFIHKIV